MLFARLLVIFIIFAPHFSQARFNNTLFKHNITNLFKPEYMQYSPTVGQIALERGLIYNLRFFGNIEDAYKVDKPSERNYIQDQGLDDMMKVVIALFPSPAGELASSTEALTNIGQHSTPRSTALLLKYAQACRLLKELENMVNKPNLSRKENNEFNQKIISHIQYEVNNIQKIPYQNVIMPLTLADNNDNAMDLPSFYKLYVKRGELNTPLRQVDVIKYVNVAQHPTLQYGMKNIIESVDIGDPNSRAEFFRALEDKNYLIVYEKMDCKYYRSILFK